VTNQQLYLAIGIPSILIILSWLSNNSRLNRVEDEIRAFRKEMFDEFKQFYRTIGQHDADIETLKKKVEAK
jgi:hypothetical protein